jgi:hypothetical protein
MGSKECGDRGREAVAGTTMRDDSQWPRRQGQFKGREKVTKKKKKTNLIEGELVEVGTLEFGLYERPEPVHWRAKGDIRRVCLSSEESKESAKSVDNNRSRISAPGERAGDIVIWEHNSFHRLAFALVGEVPAYQRLESSGTSNRGERGETTFDHVEAEVAVVVLRDRITYVALGDHASELELTFLRIFEIGRRVHTRVHEGNKLLGGDLRTWNTNS